jgi:hypothetical protein
MVSNTTLGAVEIDRLGPRGVGHKVLGRYAASPALIPRHAPM